MSAKNQFLKSTVKLTGQQADRNTRRSVSGSCIFYGGCLVYSSSRTQKIVSLSSAESETYATASAGMDAILTRVILCWILQVRILMYLYFDSSAARGILSRRGVGRLRHLSCRILWLQKLGNEKLRKCCKSKPFLAKSIQLTFPRNVSASAGWKVSWFYAESGVARALS